MKYLLIKNFYKVFDTYLPTNICEIGTHSGKSAFQFVDYLLPKVDKLNYIGYDLFEDADRETTTIEHNGKGPGSYNRAFQGLNIRKIAHPDKFTFKLVRGNTKETLTKKSIFDFVYIDGGHSFDTVIHDYSMVQDSDVIVFDDYQIPDVKRAVEQIKRNSTGRRFFELTNPERTKRRQIFMIKESELVSKLEFDSISIS